MNKKELRNKYKAIAKAITDKDKKSDIITDIVFDLVKDYKIIGLYASMDDEVKTDSLINRLLKNGNSVFLPKVEGSNLSFYQILSLDELNVTGKFQIREPNIINPLKSPLEAIIIPGICFDMNKYRIGHGMGYFDKFLSNKEVRKIGVCFDELINDTFIPYNDYDVKMDIIVTDKRVIK